LEGVIRRFVKRKCFWVFAVLIQGLAVLAMSTVAHAGLEGNAAEWVIIALMTLFSLARGVASIAWKDTLGKTVDKGRRGLVGGYAVSAAGVIASGFGLYLALSLEAARPDWLLLALLVAAGTSCIAGAMIFLTVNEHAGATDGGRGIKDVARDQFKLILGDSELQRFILSRALITATFLSGPLYVTLAPAYANGVLPFAAALFVLNIGHSGVRIGRKTQIVDIAGGDAKVEYVAESNTVIGVLLVMIGAGVAMRLENAQAS